MELRYIRAHCDLRGNEIADELAKVGAEETVEEDRFGIPLPKALFKAASKRAMRKEWELR